MNKVTFLWIAFKKYSCCVLSFTMDHVLDGFNCAHKSQTDWLMTFQKRDPISSWLFSLFLSKLKLS